ncbi:hypothetical protein ACOSP7_005021 [Xanthoceras sorbifolium]
MLELLLVWITIGSLARHRFDADALTYDYTASIECLKNPHKAQYGGGIIKNPELDRGLKGWSTFGNAKKEHRASGGNKFIVAYSRNKPHDSVSQKLYMQKNMLYTFSAWLQLSEGKFPVTAIFKTSNGIRHAGSVIAESGCWSMLKGGLTVNASGPVEIYFESNNTSVEIWVDSVSLQPFTKEEWRSHQDESIEKTRKRKVRIQAVDTQGNPLANATIYLKQNNLRLPFGCATNKNVLTNQKYQEWFISRFEFTVFDNEMKWYSTEQAPGKEDYSVPDAMMKLMKQYNIAVRGHNIFWEDPKYQPSWVTSLSPTAFALAAGRRINSIMSRYKGQIIQWDVVNENLHFNFYESKMGENASAIFYKYAHQYDPSSFYFMNEYNTIEESGDQVASPAKYIQKLREIQNYPGNKDAMGIGLEGHFREANLPYMRASLDILGKADTPIWLTEIDVEKGPNQAQYLEQILREGHGHPNVNGMMLWGGWYPEGCYRMCLTDNNMNNLPTGDVVDKLLHEWGMRSLQGTTDANGFFEVSLFHADYQLKIIHPSVKNYSSAHRFKVQAASSADDQNSSGQSTIMFLQISA